VWLFQSIGAFPDKFDQAPGPVYGAGILLLGGLLVAAMVRGRPGGRLQLLAVGLVALGVPLAISIATYGRLGPVWQGRYAWPYAGGVLVLAGVLLDRRPPRLRPALVAILLVLGVLLQVPGPLSVMAPVGSAAAWTDPHRWLVAALVVAALGLWTAAAASQWRMPAAELAADASDLPPIASSGQQVTGLPEMVAP
jgi:hypothetical protein